MKVSQKFIGDDGVEYSTEEQAKEADIKFAEKQKAAAKEKAAVSKEKKELSDKIEEARKACQEASKNFDLAKEQASSILKEARAQAERLLKDAAKDLEEKTAAKMNAVAAFNRKFGPYSVNYSSSNVKDEFYDYLRDFNRLFGLWF